MAYKKVRKLLSVDSIVEAIPLSAQGYANIEKHRREIFNIIEGKDDRLLIIVGPCSAWPESAVLEYARGLKILNEKVEDNLKLVMRTYIQKPRTIKGWTGPINQPNPLAKPNISEGTKYARNLMVKINEMDLPIADEALFTHNAQGFLELLSWVAIGARSSEDPEHRIFASAIDCPVGMKNPTHGSLKIGVNSVIAAQHSHVAVFDGYEVETTGNLHAHLVLRGGNGQPNYSLAYLEEANNYFKQVRVNNPAIIIDASHDNCLINGQKDYNLQGQVVFDVLESVKDHPELKKLIKGFMLESFIKGGNQNVETVANIDMDGLSITDPCLSFAQTEELLLNLSALISKRV